MGKLVCLVLGTLVVLLAPVNGNEGQANPNFHDPRNVHNKE